MRIKVSRVLFVLDSGEGGFPWFMFPPVGCCAYSVSYVVYLILSCSGSLWGVVFGLGYDDCIFGKGFLNSLCVVLW